jgi:cullin-associated NEDD8-dissociated protein 1
LVCHSSLGPLVGKVPSPIIAPMIEKLSTLKLKNSVDNAVPSLALRSVILALPRPVPGLPTTPDVKEAYSAISRVLIPRLIGPGPKTKVPDTKTLKLPPVPEGMLQNEGDLNADSVDVMIEVVRCFGPLLEQVEVEAMQEVILQLLESEKGTSVVKKRAVVAIAMLAVYLTEEHLDAVVERLNSGLSRTDLSPVTRKLYISILGSMARSIPSRFGPHIGKIIPHVLTALAEDKLQQHLEQLSDGDDLGQEYNEIAEAALVAVEAFLASCPQETKPFTDDMIASCLRFLKYDPNYAMDDDDEDMDDEGEDELDMDDEFEDDDGFEDGDDDASWKVRRCAAKTLYALIATRGSGDLLESGVLYRQAAGPLVKRIDEREENVRLEVLSTLSLLVRKTGEGLHSSEPSLDDYELELIAQVPPSRKRRRQSSVAASSQVTADTGVVSPMQEKVPQTGPQADLARLTPAIVKAATKHLKGKTVATKQAIINLLDDLVSVQRGGLSDYFGDIIGPITDAIKPAGVATAASLGGSGGASSATPSTLRVAALKLVSDISKTHSSAFLQPYLAKIVAAVTVAVHDRFYKISSEAVRTVEELIKTITPPRSKNTGTQYKADLDKLFEVLIDRASANDADAEVRQRAIHGLGVLISRVSSPEGAVLLSGEKRLQALGVLQEKLKNETTRLASVRAVDQVAASIQSADQLELSWVQNVLLELAAQLRKSNRSLRGSSITALKHLTLSPAAKDRLDSETIQGLVPSLLLVVTNNDTHLLGQALIILASIVADHAALVMTTEMITALCELLKTHFASIVLDQILLLVSNVGKSGNGGALMSGLLKDVSVAGEPSVVGKVIGTLLVTSGDSAGVTIDSFIGELHGSSKSGDDARVCLALAVLGEAGKGLGSDSPVKPELFLEQFRADPDKVSLSAATALGRAGSGSVEEFLPVILSKMDQSGSKQYLLIQSLKEILQSISSLEAGVRKHTPVIWEKLRSASENADNKVVCAECAGRLVTLNPAEFMPQLQVS